MSAVIATLRAPGSTELAFTRALRDPRVLRAAASADVDLSDRRALATLLARARQALLTLPAPALAAAIAVSPSEDELAGVENHHARHAVRAYLAVSRAA